MMIGRGTPKYPPIAEDMTATMTRYTPAAALNVPAETPESAQGEIEERPRPAPNAKRAKLSAAAVTAPAAMLAHDTAETDSDHVRASVRGIVSKGASSAKICSFNHR
jgi:hypothetical protein